ncbi:MAG: DUF1353 domain-containing protein [Planctomycetaceae bacterium]|nr:DUF1353 domain-containing protein [Planctomycetaceae bacterium]
MQITFTQSGGFVGAVRGCRIDAATLPADERRRLEELVAGSGLDASLELFSETGRDRRQYEIRIDRGGAAVRVCCDDACLPEPARPLVRFLAERATPRPPGWEADQAEQGLQPAVAADAAAWGRFEGQVVARWHDDGREMTLVEPFVYRDPRAVRWEAPAGAVVNGASIPRAFWSVIGGPFSGRFRNASVVHDVACVERSRPWEDVHQMFYEACRCGGVAAVTAKTMYYAVFHYGPRWRVEERRTIVAGAAVVERVVRDDTPPPPSAAEAAAVVQWFATHDVTAEAIPTLPVPPGG